MSEECSPRAARLSPLPRALSILGSTSLHFAGPSGTKLALSSTQSQKLGQEEIVGKIPQKPQAQRLGVRL